MKIISFLSATIVASLIFVFAALADDIDVIDPDEAPELYCLALNIYFEARGEPVAGQFAVADVTLNRVESEAFPDTICDVVFECRRRDICQFSWVNHIKDGQTPRIDESEAWFDAQLFAVEIYEWEVERGISGGATHFHNRSVRPHWARVYRRTTSIGAHLFYARF